jgi:hypothetical protein
MRRPRGSLRWRRHSSRSTLPAGSAPATCAITTRTALTCRSLGTRLLRVRSHRSAVAASLPCPALLAFTIAIRGPRDLLFSHDSEPCVQRPDNWWWPVMVLSGCYRRANGCGRALAGRNHPHRRRSRTGLRIALERSLHPRAAPYHPAEIPGSQRRCLKASLDSRPRRCVQRKVNTWSS